MIKQFLIENIEIEKEKTIWQKGAGKILKVFVEFYEDADPYVKLQIYTSDGEEVLNVTNERVKDIYYPRFNIARQRYVRGIVINYEENSPQELFCFFGGLVIKITKSSENTTNKVIKKLKIVYDE